MPLRPYQQEFVNNVLGDFYSNDSVLGILPTGAGKTFCFVNIADHCLNQNKKVLALMHRENLVNQARDAFLNQGIQAEVEMGSQIASHKADVVVGSIQTFSRERMNRWPIDHFRLVIVDEAHHVEANSWQETVNYFKGTKLLGVTATPSRTDGKSLSNTFEKISYEIGLLELIEQGYLSPITIKSCPLNIDIANIKNAGDYQVTQVDEVLTPFLEEAARMVCENAQDRKTIVFLPLRKTSEKFAKALQKFGMDARHVEGGKESKEVLEEFRKNKFQTICNASLLIEGYDCPDVSCVVPLRPTKSFPLFAQMVGRGTRIHPGKENMLLLDFLWEHQKHRLIRAPHLFGAHDESIEDIMWRVERGESLGEATKDVEWERMKAFERKLRILKKKKERVFDLSQVSRWTGQNLKSIENDKGEPPTDKQLALLKKFHVNLSQIKSRKGASRVINSLLNKRK